MAWNREVNLEVAVQTAVVAERKNPKPVEGAVDIDAGKLKTATAFAGGTEASDGLDVEEIKAPEVAANEFEGAAEEAALGGEVEIEQCGGLEQDGFAVVVQVGCGQAVEFGGPVVFFSAGPFGGSGEGGREGRVQSGEHRHHFVADSVAQEGGVGVRGVLAPGRTQFAEPGAHGGAGDVEEGTDDTGGGFGKDRGEAGGPGTPEESGEDGFCLVVESVAGGNGGAETFGEALRKPGVALAAGFLFQVSCRWRKGCDGAGEAKAGGELLHEGGIGVGLLAAKLVVDVEDVADEVGLVQGVEEENGICAAGDGHPEASGELRMAGRKTLGKLLQTTAQWKTYPLNMRFGLFTLLVAATVLAQEPPEVAIKVDVSLVNVAFIVRDRAGTLNRNLAKDDIEIFEDGVKQDVRFFGKSGDQPLRLALAADMSGSQEKFMKQHHRDIERFLESAVTPKDKALLVCFGNHIRVVSDFTSKVGNIMEALDRFQKGYRQFPELEPDDTRSGGTALFDSVFLTAGEKLAEATGERKAMILFSDGEDNSSAHDLMDAIEAAQSADSVIYTVRYTEAKHGELSARARYGVREMDRLAKETGGAAFDASSKSVSKALGEVAEELRSMYDVGYMSTNPNRDGSFRKVVIRVKQDGAVVRSKPGYFARP